MQKLIGKTAVITGGGSGIGLATAKLFAEHGARLLLLGRDDVARGAPTHESVARHDHRGAADPARAAPRRPARQGAADPRHRGAREPAGPDPPGGGAHRRRSSSPQPPARAKRWSPAPRDRSRRGSGARHAQGPAARRHQGRRRAVPRQPDAEGAQLAADELRPWALDRRDRPHIPGPPDHSGALAHPRTAQSGEPPPASRNDRASAKGRSTP